ncbi:MAG: M20/M25/M40 family metallo-hydrolase [Flavobacteriales bacterium]|nr:M20/M25/M40 family metallo-hydrolase [Flavobacteriales bacterium]
MKNGLLLTIILVGGIAFGQVNESLITDVTVLSHDSLEGREIGTRGELVAAHYIASRFETIGLKPFQNDSYFQEFSKKTKAHPHDTEFTGKQLSGRNVIGSIDNGSKYSIVIGAHYDHLGWGDENSLSDEHAVHNGADDNASGVAALLQLAENLFSKKLKHNIIFIAFTGEEKGLLGSHFFANSQTSGLEAISFMINMDMVGRLDEDRRLAVSGIGTSPSFVPAMETITSPEFQFKLDSSGMGPSDHTSFYLNDVPVLHFFTGQHAQYHKPEDDVELINFEGLNDVATYIEKLIIRLDKKKDLKFEKTRDASAGKRSFKVTLGIIPDYLFDGQGLKIDGVKDGRPAANAELQKDDVILKMGDLDIHSMEDYMKALGHFNPKDEIDVLFERDGEVILTKVVFD